jgi:hypothetical protein
VRTQSGKIQWVDCLMWLLVRAYTIKWELRFLGEEKCRALKFVILAFISFLSPCSFFSEVNVCTGTALRCLPEKRSACAAATRPAANHTFQALHGTCCVFVLYSLCLCSCLFCMRMFTLRNNPVSSLISLQARSRLEEKSGNTQHSTVALYSM